MLKGLGFRVEPEALALQAPQRLPISFEGLFEVPSTISIQGI